MFCMFLVAEEAHFFGVCVTINKYIDEISKKIKLTLYTKKLGLV
jgi:hypothetical protein